MSILIGVFLSGRLAISLCTAPLNAAARVVASGRRRDLQPCAAKDDGAWVCTIERHGPLRLQATGAEAAHGLGGSLVVSVDTANCDGGVALSRRERTARGTERTTSCSGPTPDRRPERRGSSLDALAGHGNGDCAVILRSLWRGLLRRTTRRACPPSRSLG